MRRRLDLQTSETQHRIAHTAACHYLSSDLRNTHDHCDPTRYNVAIMAEGMFYNVTGGYVEGIVRGYRNTLLTGQHYGNLTQVSVGMGWT